MRVRRVARALIALLAAPVAACSSVSKDTGADGAMAATRISVGMQRLGASEARGDCFAGRITDSLGRIERGEAAEIVEGAQSKAEMREGVLDASKPVRRAFIGANMRCAFVD